MNSHHVSAPSTVCIYEQRRVVSEAADDFLSEDLLWRMSSSVMCHVHPHDLCLTLMLSRCQQSIRCLDKSHTSFVVHSFYIRNKWWHDLSFFFVLFFPPLFFSDRLQWLGLCVSGVFSDEKQALVFIFVLDADLGVIGCQEWTRASVYFVHTCLLIGFFV